MQILMQAVSYAFLAIVLLLHITVAASTVPVTFYGFYAPETTHEVILRRIGACTENTGEPPKSCVDNYGNWKMTVKLPLDCPIIEFKFASRASNGHETWETWQEGGHREISANQLREGNNMAYVIFNKKPVKMQRALTAKFVLDLNGQPDYHSYTVCGKCVGAEGDPSKGTWRCELPHWPDTNKVAVFFDVYPHCNFDWKWRNVGNQAILGGYEPPVGMDRKFFIGDGVCPFGQIKTVDTWWGNRGQTHYGVCQAYFRPTTATPTMPTASKRQTLASILPTTEATKSISTTQFTQTTKHVDLKPTEAALISIESASTESPGGITKDLNCHDGEKTVILEPAEDFATLGITKDRLLSLPVGQYPYVIRSDHGQNCTLVINVVRNTSSLHDQRMQRRLVFKAQYGVRCEEIANPIARDLLTRTASSNYEQIEEVCSGECRRATGDRTLSISCTNGTLSITWPSDVSYTGAVTEIPNELKKKIVTKLKHRGRFLQIIIMDRLSPVVFPQLTSSGTSASVELETYCTNKSYYDQSLDACIDF